MPAGIAKSAVKTPLASFQAAAVLQGGSLHAWRSAQCVLLLIGLGIFGALIFFPEIGRHALWNALIPAAPALFVLAPGLWRNVCPLATVAMLPHHWKLSRRRRLSVKWQGRLELMGVLLLFLIVPARHVLLDHNPLATAILLAAVGVTALITGFGFDSKSAWCNSLCPVFPVEKLYAQRPLVSPLNAHCGQCSNCVNPCPDSTVGINFAAESQSMARRTAAILVAGGLPGFIWGWYHVADFENGASFREWFVAYGLPWGALLVSLGMLLLVRILLGRKRDAFLIRVCAAAAVSCYYWYRLPSLIGFGASPEDGRLVDLTWAVPAWSLTPVQIAVVAFFVWWLVVRRPAPAAWALRPPFANGKTSIAAHFSGGDPLDQSDRVEAAG